VTDWRLMHFAIRI